MLECMGEGSLQAPALPIQIQLAVLMFSSEMEMGPPLSMFGSCFLTQSLTLFHFSGELRALM